MFGFNCLLNAGVSGASGEMVCCRTEEGSWRRWGGIALEDCRFLVSEHLRSLQAGQSVKRDRKRKITRISHKGISYIVKDYIPTWRPEFFCPARKCWRGTRMLEGFTAPALAWLRSCHQGDFIIFRDGGTGNFFEGSYLSRPDIVPLYEKAGQLLAELHRRGLYHADTKPSNFIVNALIPELSRPVLLIDCDKVLSYSSTVPEKRRLKNLAQFTGGGKNLTDFTQWRQLTESFFLGYSRTMELSAEETAGLRRRLVELLRNPASRVENYLSDRQMECLK